MQNNGQRFLSGKVEPSISMLRNHFQTDWLIIVLLTVMALSCAWLYRDSAQDDAFITYRYAGNIASGML